MSTPAEDVSELAIRVTDALQAANIPCAVGGALALGVWGVPRGTTDVDVSTFIDETRHAELLDVLARAGCTFDRDEALRRAREGDTIFTWKDGFRVDVFVPSIPFYDDAARTAVP